MVKKVTLVIGASTNPDRYSFQAISRLRDYGHPVIAFGQRSGKVADVDIQTEWNSNWNVDTVTLYLNPSRQEVYYRQILDLKPNRVIFNPGTENSAFVSLLKEAGIATEEACTLVMLSIGNY
ncbi:MAG: CoA-binding protein [Flavobacteriia bacterium]|jgi:predicted CoA-binding protein